MHAITLTGINYGVLNETEWEGRHAVKLSPTVPGLFIRKSDLDTGFEEDGRQVKTLAVRITAEISAVDVLLNRAGWQRESDATFPLLHQLRAC
jgi:short-subunit dehydrogenase involved in D-alanine esterification of teichoic acids